jgi:hypothetical protein
VRIEFPPMKIHVWGGLGSQLFGVSLAHNLKARFPRRSLQIVLHSSGVTRREPEITQLFPELTFVNVDDFSDRSSHDSGSRKRSLAFFSTQIVRKILLFLGLLAEENTEQRFPARRWTVSIRGHYFHRGISPAFLDMLSFRLENLVGVDLKELQNEITLHYRLGDLLELSNKNFVEPLRVISVLTELRNTSQVYVFSDSPDIAISLLEPVVKPWKLKPMRLPTVETIYAALQGSVFVGTSSKISYWIVLLRLNFSKDSTNYLPVEDQRTMSILSGESSGIHFY